MANLDPTLVLSNSINILCEYILRCGKKNNGVYSNISNASLGAFKKSPYDTYYKPIQEFAKVDMKIDNIGKIICEIFFNVANNGFLNSNSYSVLNLLLTDKFTINNFKACDDYKKRLLDVKTEMLKEFEQFDVQPDDINFTQQANDQMNNEDSGVNNTDPLNIHNQSPLILNENHNQMLTETQNEEITVSNWTELSFCINKIFTQFSTIESNMTVINSNVMLNSRNTDDKFKNFAKLVNSNNTVRSYYEKIESLTKDIQCSTNNLKLLNNYKQEKRTPPSLDHYHFPKPMFNNSLDKEYFSEYNKCIEICQTSLLDLNLRELERKIEASRSELSNIKDILSISEDNLDKNILDIENKVKKSLDHTFTTTHEKYCRIIQEPVLKFPYIKPTKELNKKVIDDAQTSSKRTINSGQSEKTQNKVKSSKKKNKPDSTKQNSKKIGKKRSTSNNNQRMNHTSNKNNFNLNKVNNNKNVRSSSVDHNSRNFVSVTHKTNQNGHNLRNNHANNSNNDRYTGIVASNIQRINDNRSNFNRNQPNQNQQSSRQTNTDQVFHSRQTSRQRP